MQEHINQHGLIEFFFFFVFSVVILDTTTEATLEWTRYPYGPQANTPGVSKFYYLIENRGVIFMMNFQ